jgi:protein-S-isoprenylcysteine O-methyltransferase Ste14
MLRIPPPIWMLTYVGAGLAASAALGWPPGLQSRPLGAFLILIGLAPLAMAVVQFRRAGTEIQPTSPANKALIVAGAYRFTRNPMYLGLAAASLGFALWIGAWPLLLAPVLFWATTNFVHIPFEEAKMRRQFGEAYDDYCGRVRRWI